MGQLRKSTANRIESDNFYCLYIESIIICKSSNENKKTLRQIMIDVVFTRDFEYNRMRISKFYSEFYKGTTKLYDHT